MAYRQPVIQAPPQRTYAPENSQSSVPYQAHHPRRLEESQEWILFSPVAASSTDRSYTESSQLTAPTPGRSRLSDYGSLDTATRSYGYAGQESPEQTEAPVEDDDADDGELDSLDSHLHAFRAEPSMYRHGLDIAQDSAGTVLPTHDGLGSFRVDQTAMGEAVQEHLYSFERYNPRRVKRRRQSMDLETVDPPHEETADLERTRRIEDWRMEQSRVLLEEIQKETRRRRQSMSSERRSTVAEQREEDLAAMDSGGATTMSRQASDGLDEGKGSADDSESFWNRITRRVIRDLMSVDERLWSIILGEALAEDDELSTTPIAGIHGAGVEKGPSTKRPGPDDTTWEHRLLERIARELGIVASAKSDHPGSFSTYPQVLQQPLPYAGLPIISESPPKDSHTSIPVQSSDRAIHLSPTTSQTFLFQPTIPAQPLDMPGLGSSTPRSQLIDADATPRPSFLHTVAAAADREEQAYWERDLDLKLVFRYLRSRFTSGSPGPSLPSASSPPSAAAGAEMRRTVQTDAARAARVRAHHPLVSRASARPSAERRTFGIHRAGGVGGAGAGGGGAAAAAQATRKQSSSCASLSTRAASVGLRSESSRHYWDFGGSMGSGSGVIGAGGGGGGGGSGGGWGEI